jgi:hypothetical protein
LEPFVLTEESLWGVAAERDREPLIEHQSGASLRSAGQRKTYYWLERFPNSEEKGEKLHILTISFSEKRNVL